MSGAEHGKPTLEVVAHAAGVSRATVSRVINGGHRVDPQTIRSVQRAIERLGYSPNRAARSLVTRRSDSIGLVIPEPTARLFGDPFFPRLVRGVSEVLSARDLQLVLLAPQSRADEDRLSGYLTSGHVDGALLVSLHADDPLPGNLVSAGVPVVVGGRPPDGVPISYVDMDNVNGARAAVDHLIATGRRHIATVSGPRDMAAAADRLQGYREALSAAGIRHDPRLEVGADFDQDMAQQRFGQLLERHPEIDAVFAASDPMALGVLQALRQAGRAVPDDVAVVGFDDSAVAVAAEPPLSSVRQPIEEMGREMTRLLIDSLAPTGRVARRLILATELVVRASSGGDAAAD
ncbi:MAG TPA: LacI family DNA-binding transcriptional regulator [Candidatus Limnocylindria bacterium]|nr:LacI family DNA-binding transcriptional regulator [Candidatus Limnocylindria bacterium]